MAIQFVLLKAFLCSGLDTCTIRLRPGTCLQSVGPGANRLAAWETQLLSEINLALDKMVLRRSIQFVAWSCMSVVG
jgi:hypothetical protein